MQQVNKNEQKERDWRHHTGNTTFQAFVLVEKRRKRGGIKKTNGIVK